MATKFQFKVLNGADPDTQYAAIVTKDPLTFYLLNNGIAYLGTTPLFGGSVQTTIVRMDTTIASAETGKIYILSNVTSTVGVAEPGIVLTGMYTYNGTTLISFSDQMIGTYISNILVNDMVNGFTPSSTEIPTTQAIYDYVANKLNDSSLINAAFFKAVTGHTISQEEFDAAALDPQSPYAGFPVGDVGLLFTADTDGTAGGETYYYVSLQNYVNIYNAANTTSVNMTLDTETNTFTAELRIKVGENSVLVDAAGGIYLDKVATVNDTTPSADKIVTESALVDFITNKVMVDVQEAIDAAVANTVTYTVDPTA